MAPTGAVVQNIDPPPAGTYWQYTTGSSSTQTNAGIRYAQAFIRRDFDARLKCKVRIPSGTTGNQFLFGFTVNDIIEPAQDIILNTHSAFLVGYRSTDSGSMYHVYRNSGTSAQTATVTVDNLPEVPRSTSAYRTIEIAFQNQGATCVVTVQNIATTPPYAATTLVTRSYTTNLPAITSPGTGGSIYMRPVIQITNRESVAHTMNLHYMELESNF